MIPWVACMAQLLLTFGGKGEQDTMFLTHREYCGQDADEAQS